MKLIKYKVNNGFKNMQIDSDLLDNAIAQNQSEPTFRLYGWSPKCLSLGRNQEDEFVNLNLDKVKRLTGGRALLHDNEITYSYVCKSKDGQSIIDSYKEISGILIKFFKTLGIELDFGESKKIATHYKYCMLISTGADVCYRNKKLIGSAQCRKNGYILQHGSILFDYDKSFIEKLFKEEVNGITCIKEILPNLSKEDLITKLENYIIYL